MDDKSIITDILIEFCTYDSMRLKANKTILTRHITRIYFDEREYTVNQYYLYPDIQMVMIGSDCNRQYIVRNDLHLKVHRLDQNRIRESSFLVVVKKVFCSPVACSNTVLRTLIKLINIGAAAEVNTSITPYEFEYLYGVATIDNNLEMDVEWYELHNFPM